MAENRSMKVDLLVLDPCKSLAEERGNESLGFAYLTLHIT